MLQATARGVSVMRFALFSEHRRSMDAPEWKHNYGFEGFLFILFFFFRGEMRYRLINFNKFFFVIRLEISVFSRFVETVLFRASFGAEGERKKCLPA